METLDEASILRSMLEGAKRLARDHDHPALEARAPFLVAFLHDTLRVVAPFDEIEHVVDDE